MEKLNMEIGQRIQNLRRLHHVTQECLAEKLDVSAKHISSVERGMSSLSLERLVQASVILDCSMDYLIFGSDAADTECYIPKTILEVFSQHDMAERDLLQQYLIFFTKMHV